MLRQTHFLGVRGAFAEEPAPSPIGFTRSGPRGRTNSIHQGFCRVHQPLCFLIVWRLSSRLYSFGSRNQKMHRRAGITNDVTQPLDSIVAVTVWDEYGTI